MARVKSGVISRARHKKILKLAKGFRGRAKTCFAIAIERVERALQYAYRDRRNRKRDLRGLWIQRINAAAREYDLTYSALIGGMKKANISIDRKILAEIAVNNRNEFSAIIERVKQVLKAA